MSRFRAALRAHRRREENRRWLFVPCDQLTDSLEPPAREPAKNLGIIVVECPEKAELRITSRSSRSCSQTCGTLRSSKRRAESRCGMSWQAYAAALEPFAAELGRAIEVMRPAQRELDAELARWLESSGSSCFRTRAGSRRPLIFAPAKQGRPGAWMHLIAMLPAPRHSDGRRQTAGWPLQLRHGEPAAAAR